MNTILVWVLVGSFYRGSGVMPLNNIPPMADLESCKRVQAFIKGDTQCVQIRIPK